MCRFTMRELSISRKSASIRSFSSGARICTKLTAPYFLSHAELLAGAELEAGRRDKVLWWKGRWGQPVPLELEGHLLVHVEDGVSWASRALPSRTSAATPSRLKLFSTSVSMRSSRGLAERMLSASMEKVRYLVLIRPLLPRASWFCSICVYSTRMGSKSSPGPGW